jgi:hypothetical protein
VGDGAGVDFVLSWAGEFLGLAHDVGYLLGVSYFESGVFFYYFFVVGVVFAGAWREFFVLFGAP